MPERFNELQRALERTPAFDDLQSPVNFKGVLASTGDLPIGGNTTGDAYLVNGTVWVWSGSAWTDQGELRGGKGDKGDQGVQGLRGPRGERGEPGIDGLTEEEIEQAVIDALAAEPTVVEAAALAVESELEDLDLAGLAIPGDEGDIKQTINGEIVNSKRLSNAQRSRYNLMDYGGDPTGATYSDQALADILYEINAKEDRSAEIVLPPSSYFTFQDEHELEGWYAPQVVWRGVGTASSNEGGNPYGSVLAFTETNATFLKTGSMASVAHWGPRFHGVSFRNASGGTNLLVDILMTNQWGFWECNFWGSRNAAMDDWAVRIDSGWPTAPGGDASWGMFDHCTFFEFGGGLLDCKSTAGFTIRDGNWYTFATSYAARINGTNMRAFGWKVDHGKLVLDTSNSFYELHWEGSGGPAIEIGTGNANTAITPTEGFATGNVLMGSVVGTTIGGPRPDTGVLIGEYAVDTVVDASVNFFETNDILDQGWGTSLRRPGSPVATRRALYDDFAAITENQNPYWGKGHQIRVAQADTNEALEIVANDTVVATILGNGSATFSGDVTVGGELIADIGGGGASGLTVRQVGDEEASMVAGDQVVVCNATTAGRIFYLLSAATTAGTELFVKRIGSQPIWIWPAPGSGDTFEGLAEIALARQNAIAHLVSDGVAWRIVGIHGNERVPGVRIVNDAHDGLIADDTTVFINSTTAGHEFRMSLATGDEGREVTLKRIGTQEDWIFPGSGSGEEIEGDTFITLAEQGASVDLVASGGNWHIVGSHGDVTIGT